MRHTVTLIQGDGIGPEVTEAARRCLEASGANIEWERAEIGATALEKEGELLPPRLLKSIRKNRVALKGPATTPVGSGFRSVNVALRKELDLYACLRPCRSYRGIPTRFEGTDIVVVRENTEDLYIGIEFAKDSKEAGEILKIAATNAEKEIDLSSAVSLKVISDRASRRIVTFAFEYARSRGRKKVTAGHKANIIKFSDGLFLEVAKEVAEGHADIAFEDRMIDNLCAQLVRDPRQFDVLVLPNLYGDIVSDLCAGLVGGLGVAPGANLGDDIAVFEPVHGSAPKYAGMNKTNPTATILSGVMMLRHIGEDEAAARLDKAIEDVLAEGKSLTYDLVPGRDERLAVGTSDMADAIIAHL